MRETWEEAGVKGVITRHIGVFAEKSKTGVKAHHWIYEMEIKEVTKKFPEQKKRERRWVSLCVCICLYALVVTYTRTISLPMTKLYL